MTRYAYRRRLTKRELVPALGAGAGVGLAVGAVVAYLTQIVLRRAPLDGGRGEADRSRAPHDAPEPPR